MARDAVEVTDPSKSGLVLSNRVTKAFELAHEVHADQTLKGSELPYLLHLMDVCSIALRHGADEDEAIAALLHDAVEDGGGMPLADRIGSEFGERVRTIVLECSDSVTEDSDMKRPWWDRKLEYLDHLRRASAGAALVSAADKLSNARSLVTDVAEHGDPFWERFSTGRAGSLWYYRRIAELLPARLPATDGGDRLGRALRATIQELVESIDRDLVASDWEWACNEEERRRMGSSSSPSSRPTIE